MRNTLRKNTSPVPAPEQVEQASPGRHLLGVLLNGPGRIRSGHQSHPGGLASQSLFRRRHAFPILALLAALAFGLLFLLPGGILNAQDDMIEYPEKGMDAVATFTAEDPEGRMVYWSLAPAATDPDGDGDLDTTDAADAAEFSISSDGVLSFKFSPDYEMPKGEARTDTNTNTYRVVVVASDDPTGAGTDGQGAGIRMGYKKVTVNVTDVDEPGMVTLSAQKPQIGVALTATLTDDDATETQITAAEWVWAHSDSKNGPWIEILTTTDSGYTPLGVEDKYLRVTATYTDGHGSGKSAQMVSDHAVRAAPPNNAVPVFLDEDDVASGIQVGRKVDENSPPGTNVGKPVTANDTAGDVLTYTFSGGGSDDSDYKIDPATGQITVGPRTALNREGPNDTDTVEVVATDPFGIAPDTPQSVTITINDVNEAPSITEGVTKTSRMEDDADVTTDDDAVKTVSTYTGSDVDQNVSSVPLIWSVKGTDAGDFEISSTGALTFKEVPNYEMPADSNMDNVYMVIVVATDAGVDAKNKMTAERAVVVTVTNVEEDGTVTLTSVQPKIGFPVTASVTDPDDGVMDTTWKWERDDGTAGSPTTECDNATGWEDAEDGMGYKTATYTPDAKDEGKCLRATAMYTDGKGMDETMEVSDNAVVEDLANKPPRFRAGGVDSDDTTGANTGDTAMSAKRSIAENGEPDTTADPNPADVGMPLVADDPNGDTLTYSLSGNDAGSFMIGSSDGQIRAKMKLDREDKSSHMVTVTATDPNGAEASIDVTITVTNVDEAPVIAGDDVTKDYRENGTAQVARFTAEDPEGRMVYWSLAPAATDPDGDGDLDTTDAADAAEFSIGSDGVLSFKFSPDYEMPKGEARTDTNTNTYRVVVVASDDPTGAGTDGQGAGIRMGYKKVTVNVTDVEETETVTLSAQQGQVSVALMATYNDADNERAANGNPDLTWKWYLGNSPISDATTATYIPENPGTHRVEASYTKTDGNKKAVSETISVRAVPSASNATPVFPSGSDARSVDENSPPGTNVGKPVKADDTDGDRLHYTLTDSTNTFIINPATGQITVAPRAMLNADTDGTASYPVTVTATDPWGTGATPSGQAPQSVTITINDVNEAPSITEGVTKTSRMEDDADVTTDDDAVKTVSTYTGSDVDQNVSSVPLIWSVKGTDAGDFEISSTGALTFKEVPNYEMPADSNMDNVYMVIVVATDAGVDAKNKMTAERAVVVTVTNVGEDGTVTLTSVQPKIGFPVTASVTDPDDGVMDTTWKWERDDGTAGSPTTECDNATGWEDAEDGMGYKTATYTPDAKDEGKCLRATAMYTDGKGMDETMEVSDNAVVEDLANKPPRFRAGGVDSDDTTGANTGDTAMSAKRSIAENGEPDTTADPNPADVGMPLVADDPNGDTLTYSLSGNDAGSFMIGSSDGQIRAKMKLDREDKSSHMVTVTATDPNGAEASIDVTITVTNVDEAPVIMVGGLGISGPTSVSLPEDDMTTVRSYTAVGAEASSARWTLEGADNGDFMVQPRSGMSVMLQFRNAPNYESPADADTNNMYMVTLKAIDSEGNMATKRVTVTVTNEEEAGRVTFWRDGADATTAAIMVGDELGGAVDDSDGNPGDTFPIAMYKRITAGNITSWQWARSMDMTDWEDIGTGGMYTVMDDDEGYYLRATATYTDGEGSGKMASEKTIMVGADDTGGTLLDRYDVNPNNGMIDLDEVFKAIDDYFDYDDRLTLAQVYEIVDLYFES